MEGQMGSSHLQVPAAEHLRKGFLHAYSTIRVPSKGGEERRRQRKRRKGLTTWLHSQRTICTLPVPTNTQLVLTTYQPIDTIC